MIDIKTLLGDPMFQLNLLLWSLMDTPDDLEFSIELYPFLRNQGYYLYAIEKKIDLRSDFTYVDAISPLIKGKLSPPTPDLWIKHQSDPVELIVELKSRGYSADSNKSIQMLKIMAASADLSETLGGGSRKLGHVIFITILEDAKKMLSTFTVLENRLKEGDIISAPTSVIGLRKSEGGVDFISPKPSQLPSPLRKSMSNPVTVLRFSNIENNVIPLYFIPWMPGIVSQDKRLSNYGLSVLTGRLLTHVQKVIGKASIPSYLNLRGDVLLDVATFGVFRYWKAREKQRFMQEAIRIIARAVEPHGRLSRNETELEIDLSNETVRDEAMRGLRKSKTEEEASNLSRAAKPTLFDDILE